MKNLVFFLLAFLPFTYLLGQPTVETSGDNSPAVIAQNFSATYGVRADAVEAILWIYDAEGYDMERRKRATEQILRDYAQSPEREQQADELSEATRSKINNPAITSALEWDLFARSHYLSTTGYNSPAVMAKGDVNIWYGIPPKTLRALAEVLEKNQTDLGNFETRLADQVKKYEELRTELQTYGSQEKIYRQAEALLEEGRLEEAEQLIESDFDASMKRQAYKGYIYGQTKQLLLKYEEATKGYKNAVQNDEGNSTYHLYYANNENTLARYDQAIKHYEIALGIDSLKRDNEERIATLINNLGVAWDSKGGYDQAIGYIEKALQINIKALGENHPYVAGSYNNLGEAWQAKGAYDQAIGYYEKALQINIKALGENHPAVAKNYNNLGVAWDSKGGYDQAIGYYEKALQINTKALGENHPDVATIYNNLGEAWRAKGSYDQAIGYYEKALQIDLKVFGENHPDVARNYNNLGAAWYSKGAYDQAIGYIEKALQINIKALGENHTNVAMGYNNLGGAWQAKGEYDQAIGYYEKALQINIKAFGENHPDVATNYNNLGGAWRAKGAYDQAIEYYEKCQKIWDTFLDPTHPNQKTTARNLSRAANSQGMALYREEKYEAALPYFQKALQNAQKADDAAFVLTCLNDIGATQKQLQDYSAALQILDAGLAIATQMNVEIDKVIQEEQLTPEMLATPEVQAEISELKNLALIRRMQYHKVGCLKGLKRDKEAETLARQLWQEGIEANDERLLEDLKKEGYDFGR